MQEDLIKARSHIIQAALLLHKHFTKRLWPFFYEDPDRLIKDIGNCLEAIRRGERLPLSKEPCHETRSPADPHSHLAPTPAYRHSHPGPLALLPGHATQIVHTQAPGEREAGPVSLGASGGTCQ